MQNALRLGLLVTVLLGLGRTAQAQESHKFNAKALEAKFSLPVYPSKGSVVGNEVVESANDSDHQKMAIWSVKAGDLKKALDFYAKALGGEPKKELTDDGSEKYTFKKQEEGATRRRVVVLHDKLAHQVQVQLWMRTYESAADAE
jgi:hypothetical protein